jgi:hypothetical protein
MLVVLLLPLVSVAADTRRTNQPLSEPFYKGKEIQQIMKTLLLGKRVSGRSVLPMITIAPVQVARTFSIRFVAEWRQGYDFARDARIEINGVIQHEWTFSHSTDQTFQDTLDTTVSNTIKAYTIYARDDELQSRYYGHLYVDGNLVASSDDAGPLTPLVYAIPPSGGPERLEIAYVEYPRSVRTGEAFVVDVEVAYALRSPTDVAVDLYEHGGPLVASKRRVLSGDGSQVFDLSVTAPSAPGRWQLNIHLQGEFKQSIYIDVGEVCNEDDVRNVVMCPDGVNWEQREVCRNTNWVPESQRCPVCSEGDVQVLETCPDGSWSHRRVCRNNAWDDEYQPCPECSEGAVRNVVMCPDGVNWEQREVCRNNNWVPESQPCPLVCSEGAVVVLESCADGSWKHRRVCRNNAWHDEYQQCLTPPQVFSLKVLVFPQELGLTVQGSGNYPAGDTVTLEAPNQADDMYLLGWWLDGVPKTLTQEFTVKMDAPHQAAAVYVKPSAYKSIVASIKKQLVDNIEDVSKEVVEKAKQLGPDEHVIDITIDLDLTAMGAIEDYAGWALFAKDSNYFAGKLSTLLSYAFDVTQLGIDASKCAQKENCDIDKIKEDLLDFAETNFVVGADLLLAYAVCAAVLGVPTAGAGAILCPVATSLVIIAVRQVKIGDKNIFEHLRDGVDKLTDWIAKGICKLAGWILRRTVCTIAGSDVKLLIVDPKGLRTGATLENGQWVTYGEISTSWYGGLESYPQYVVISDPESGSYRLVVTGKGGGSYELQVTSMVDGSVVATEQYSRDIKQGETVEYSSQLMSDGKIVVRPPAAWWDLYWPFVLGGAVAAGSAGTFLALKRSRRRASRLGRPRVKEIRPTAGKPRVKSIQDTKPRVLRVDEE